MRKVRGQLVDGFLWDLGLVVGIESKTEILKDADAEIEIGNCNYCHFSCFSILTENIINSKRRKLAFIRA